MLWVLIRIASFPEGGHVAILIDHHLRALKVDAVFELNKWLIKSGSILFLIIFSALLRAFQMFPVNCQHYLSWFELRHEKSCFFCVCKNIHVHTAALTYNYKSNRKAMNRNWNNQKANPALKTKAGSK